MNRYSVLNLWQRLALLVSLTTSTALPAYAAGDAAEVPDATTPARSDSATVLVGVRAGTDTALDEPAAAGSIVADLAERVAATAQTHVLRLPGEALPADLEGAQSSVADVQVYRLQLPAGADVAEAIAALSAAPGVVYAEPDPVAHIVADPPTDPLYAMQWGLSRIHAPGAWATVTGSPEVTIAVIDSGIDAAHPDLAGQLWVNPGEIAGNGLDDDNNGHIDDIHGWNIYGDNADLSDTTGHGTQVAGVIAAAANNGAGGVGVCWGCRLMIVKVTQPGGVANYSDIAAGIAYAASKGAEVINLSLGGSSDSATLRAAVAAAAQTAVVVGGAGNDDAAAPFYPAAYDEALAVAGADASDVKTSTSNYGPWVDVTAPGEVITTTLSGGGYGAASGTSVAAPFASGLAGLLRSQHPDWSAALTRAQITHTAVNVDAANPGLAGQLGSGRVDALEALQRSAVPELSAKAVTIDGLPGTVLKRGTSIVLSISLDNTWGVAQSLSGSLSTLDPYVTITGPAVALGALGSGATGSMTFTLNVSPVAPYGHTVPLTLALTAAEGYAANVAVSLQIEAGELIVSGIVSTSTTWTRSYLYHITGNVGVNPGVTLTIEAGTTVLLDPNQNLYIGGTLIADGDPGNPIRFSLHHADPITGNGFGIYLVDTSVSGEFDADLNYVSGSIIRHTIIEGPGWVYGNDSSPYFTDNEVRSAGTTHGVRIWGNLTRPTLVARNRLYDSGMEIGGAVFNPPPVYVLDNTIEGGELSVSENGTVSGNSLTNCPSTALRVYSSVVTRNRVVGCGAGGGINATTSASGNLIANNAGTGLNIGGAAFSDNTIVGNGGPALLTWNNSPYQVHGNNVLALAGQPALYQDSTGAVAADGNWWGTTSLTDIGALIVDGMDVFGHGIVSYSTPLSAPSVDAPAFVTNVAISPDATLGIQTGTFDVQFSRPMDAGVNPIVSFGAMAPFTSFIVRDDATWVSDSTWRATFDVTTLTPRGTYTVSVSSARGTDGIEIASDTRFHVTIDYAGQITDQTAPGMVVVRAGGGHSGPGSVEGAWGGSDPDSSITGYRFAIGTAPGSADVVSWTETTSPRLSRTGLGLTPGQTYWLSVQARNVGGLWSNVALDGFTAGQPLYWVNLPQVRRP